MRKPDLVIGPPAAPYMLRWQLWKSRGGFQICLHKILRSDDDRALHDHSGDNLSVILTAGYWEVLTHEWEPFRARFRWPLWPYFRKAETPHRLELASDGVPVWSLWFRWPPRREWGFYCPKGWRHWRDYCVERDYNAAGVSTVGVGCD